MKRKAILPQNIPKQYISRMVKNEVKRKKARKKFIAVDVWRSQFGPVSVRAIYEVYAQEFGVETHNMKKYSLSHCINALRKLEDEDYEEPQDQISQ